MVSIETVEFTAVNASTFSSTQETFKRDSTPLSKSLSSGEIKSTLSVILQENSKGHRYFTQQLMETKTNDNISLCPLGVNMNNMLANQLDL